MPRYHFDSECGGFHYQDPDGIELASLDEARQQLAELLRDLTFNSYPESENISAVAQVKCNGVDVLQGSCTITISGDYNDHPHSKDLLT